MSNAAPMPCAWKRSTWMAGCATCWNSCARRSFWPSCPNRPGFVGELRPYQRRGLGWLVYLRRLGLGACLADDMGLGKTVQAIAMLLHERAESAPRSSDSLHC